MEKKWRKNTINKRKRKELGVTYNEALMLLLSLHHYYAKQKQNAQHTYIAIH